MRLIFSIATTIICFSSVSCEKEAIIQAKEYPFVYMDHIEIDDGITFYAKVSYKGKDEIIDHGFIIEEEFSHYFGYKKNVSMDTLAITQNEYSYRMPTGIARVEGIKYKVKAYTKTSEITVYSNQATFISPVRSE